MGGRVFRECLQKIPNNFENGTTFWEEFEDWPDGGQAFTLGRGNGDFFRKGQLVLYVGT